MPDLSGPTPHEIACQYRWERAQASQFADRATHAAWLAYLDGCACLHRATQAQRSASREWERSWGWKAVRRAESYLEDAGDSTPLNPEYTRGAVEGALRELERSLRRLPRLPTHFSEVVAVVSPVFSFG